MAQITINEGLAWLKTLKKRPGAQGDECQDVEAYEQDDAVLGELTFGLPLQISLAAALLVFLAASARARLIPADLGWRSIWLLHFDRVVLVIVPNLIIIAVGPLCSIPPSGRGDDIVDWRVALASLVEHLSRRQRLGLVQGLWSDEHCFDQFVTVGPAQISEYRQRLDIEALIGQAAPHLARLAFESFSREPQKVLDDRFARYLCPCRQKGQSTHSARPAVFVGTAVENQRFDGRKISVAHRRKNPWAALVPSGY